MKLAKMQPKRLQRKSDRKSLMRDERYLELIPRYRRNFILFCIEILSFIPTYQQAEIMEELVAVGFRVSVVSGHGTGKTRIFAAYIVWQMFCYPFSIGLITSSNFDQLKKCVWKELEIMKREFEKTIPWARGQFVLKREAIHHRDYQSSWFFAPKTAPVGKPENVAGMHDRRYTVLVDEASGVADDTLAVFKAALTEEDNCFMMVSQGTRNTGLFYESHNQKKHLYKTFALDSELSPRVTIGFIKEKLDEYGGFHSTNYQVKVKGCFPDNQGGYLIPRSWAEATCLPDIIINHDTPPGIIHSVDVAGDGRDSSVILTCLVSGYKKNRKLETLKLEEFPFMSNINDLESALLLTRKEFGGKGTIIVDGIGVGGGLCDNLDHKGIENIRYKCGVPSFQSKEYRNKRAEGYWWFREAVYHKRIKTEENPKLYSQMANLPYFHNESGLFQMMSKKEMATKGIKSPDLADVYMQAFMCTYEPDESGHDDDDTADEMSHAKELMRKAIGGEIMITLLVAYFLLKHRYGNRGFG